MTVWPRLIGALLVCLWGNGMAQAAELIILAALARAAPGGAVDPDSDFPRRTPQAGLTRSASACQYPLFEPAGFSPLDS